jgi:L-fucose isomerase-like protein
LDVDEHFIKREDNLEKLKKEKKMIVPRVGFIVYGVHKDGLKDPMGTPFIDDKLIEDSIRALQKEGVEVVVHKTVVATKREAKEVFREMKIDDTIDCIILFTGTWVWASNIIGALRDYAKTGKGILIWTVPGSQGWRPVGGLVMNGALKEIDVKYKFVYGSYQDKKDMESITGYCKASHLKNYLDMSTVGVFGGRGMGQTCGVADPSQWMKKFGIDIDSRDVTQLIERAKSLSPEKIEKVLTRLEQLFENLPEKTDVSDRSIRLYLAIKETVEEEEFDFYSIQSFPGMGDDYSATCFAQSMMLEDGVPTSTLSDFNTLLTVVLLTKLSKERVYYGDLQYIDKQKKEIKIIGDGTIPPSLAGGLGKPIFAEHGIPTEGKAGGLSISLVCKPGTGVLARLGRNNGEFEMVLVRCSIFEPSKKEIEKRKEECGIPFWPHAFVKVDCDIDELIQNWNNEYACLGYGEKLYNALIDFCEMTDIKVILP